MQLDFTIDATDLELDVNIPLSELLELELTINPNTAGGVEQYANLAAFPLVGVDSILYIALDTSKTYYWLTDEYVLTAGGASGGGIEQYDSLSEFPATGQDTILYVALDTGKTYYWLVDTYVATAGGASTKEDITGLKLADSPEFADTKITRLNTSTGGAGDIPAAQWTWLGATAKSALSVFTKLIGYLYDLFRITKEPTGFVNPELVIITCNDVSHTVTLTGTVEAYYQGKVIAELVSGWVSAPHGTADNTSYYLYYNGSAFVWGTVFPGFNVLLIAVVKHRTAYSFGVRECHGLMPWQAHQNAHYNLGTYRESGGDISGIVLLSNTASERRPDVSDCVIWDEDLPSTNAALLTKLYSQRYISGASSINYNFAAADIVPLSGNNPYYNSFSSPNYGQTLMPANSFMTVWLYEVPVTADADSQRIRHVFVQGQSITTAANSSAGALTTAYNTELLKTTAELYLGESLVVSAEYVCIHKFIIQYTASNWSIRGSIKITGSRANQVGAIAGNYLSIVSVGEGLSGEGTPLNPLKVTPSNTNVFAAALDLSNFDLHYSNYTMVGALQLSVGTTNTAIIGGACEGVIIGDGTNTPTLSGITLWPGSPPFNPALNIQNHFMVVKFQNTVYISYYQLN